MRRAWLPLFGAAVFLAVACSGLLVDQGNDFPCDFNAPEEVRDKPCAPSEVCSVVGHCVRFVYEGPQFEGPPNFPTFDKGKKVHPLQLDGPISVITAGGHNPDAVAVLMDPGAGGQARALGVQIGALPLLTDLVTAGVIGAVPPGLYQAALANSDFAAVFLKDGGVVLTDGGQVSFQGLPTPLRTRALRVGDDAIGLLRQSPGTKLTGAVLDRGGQLTPLLPSPDAGLLASQAVLEMRWLPATRKLLQSDAKPILLTQAGFFYPPNAFSYTALTPEEDPSTIGLSMFLAPSPLHLILRHDPTATLFAYARPHLLPLEFPGVLSTWLLARKGGEPDSMTRAWSDCTPCVNGRIITFAPNFDGIANVEVVCGTLTASGVTIGLVRVTGAASPDPDQACVTQPVTPAFELTNANVVNDLDLDGVPLAFHAVLDDVNGGGVLAGGRHGEIWHGPSFSHALPLFLERVPLSVGSFNLPSDGGSALAVAITDRYIAAVVPDIGLVNGFKAFDLRKLSEFMLDDDARVRAMVGESGGWAVLANGALTHLTPRTGPLGGFKLTYGQQLVTARGEPAHEPFLGEAVNKPDGTLVSLVLTADDSLYLVPSPVEGNTPGAQGELFPQLTPEPGSPIRSLALERTPAATNGVDRLRGFAVTSRNLYLVALSGTPARWSATPVLLGGGEPLEVWMDNPRGGLGRVGYRDGTIYTLPGGFPLARPKDGKEPSQVLDYENLGGWPVAYATSGLYEAVYGQLASGKLDNKLPDGRPGKPMDWVKKTMPDGSEPWMTSTSDGGTVARPGRLHVLSGPVVQGMNAAGAIDYEQTFILSLYLEDAVYEVGQMTRKNTSALK